MVGKAEKRSDSIDYAKFMNEQTQQNYGLLRSEDLGAPKERSYSIGTALLDPTGDSKLSQFGGVLLGSLGFFGITTDELAADGIIDTNDYNAPRLIIANTGANSLKVLIPTIKDGQEIWIRAVEGDTLTIEHTAGTGNETTGNFDLMAQSTYIATDSDDWIGFHYDAIDSKFHQITAGRQNIGGGSGSEVFTWSADHSANNKDLTNLKAVLFNAGGSITGFAGDIDHDVAAGKRHDFSVNSSVVGGFSSSGLLMVTNITLTGANLAMGTGNIIMSGGDISGVDRVTFGSGNYIDSDPAGNLEYVLGSSSDDHEFFYGTSGVFRLNGGTGNAEFFTPLLMGNNGIFTCTGIENGTGSGSGLSLAAGVQLGSTTGTFNLSDSTGLFFATGTSACWFLRDLDPFSGATYDLGNTTESWDDIYLDDSVIQRESYAAGTAPVAVSGWAQHFHRDDGAGKTQYRIKFQTGTSVLIATEP